MWPLCDNYVSGSFLQRDLGEDQTRHENLKKKNDMVSSDVERFKNRQAYLNEVKCLKIKKYWVVSRSVFCLLRVHTETG